VILFHFTAAAHLEQILADRLIKTTESNISMMIANAGPPVVWLTDTPTAELGHGLNLGSHDKTAVRFEVDVPGIRWMDWAPKSTMDPRWVEILLRIGGGQEAADHWYIWPAPIRSDRWRAIHAPHPIDVPRQGPASGPPLPPSGPAGYLSLASGTN
jgi:hypothetical protein